MPDAGQLVLGVAGLGLRRACRRWSRSVQLPSASSCHDWLCDGLATVSSVVPLLPEAESTPWAKPVSRPSGS